MTAMIDFDVDGPAAPPRSNGELVFEEPWQSRAFGLAMSLHESGAFTWDEFRAELISAIAAWEEQAVLGEDYSYYQCWVTALEQVTVRNELVTSGDLVVRARDLALRPAGHAHENDHGHDHDHDHDHDHGSGH